MSGRDWNAAWTRATETRYALEYRLLGSILCDPILGLRRADAAGVDASTFTADDLQAIYLAAVVKRAGGKLTGDRDADRLAVAVLARRVVGQWARWSNEVLCELFESEFTTAFVPVHADRLGAFAGGQREVVEHLRYAYRLLTEQLVA